MTHLSTLLDNAGIPEDLKRQIREAVGKDMQTVMFSASVFCDKCGNKSMLQIIYPAQEESSP